MPDFMEAGYKRVLAKIFLCASLVLLLVLPACTTKPQQVQRNHPAVVAEKASVKSSRGTPEREGRTAKKISAIKPTAAALVAAQLKGAYVVNFIGKDSLSVRRLSATADLKYSLFEQAILLGKIRSSLKRSLMEFPAIASATTFQNGIVEIPFDAAVVPYSAAGAISQILAIRGVNQINAHFPATPDAPLGI